MKAASLLLTFVVVFSMILGNMPSIQSLDTQKEIGGFPTGWTDDVRMTHNETTPDAFPALDVNGDIVHLVWQRATTGAGGHYDIMYKNSTNGGYDWSNTVQLTSGTSGIYCDYPDIAVNNSQIHVVWDDNDAISIGEIKYRNSSDGGITWSPSKFISADDGFNSEGAKIAINNSNLHVVWVDTRHGAESVPANTELYYNRSLDGGITWEGEQRLTNAWYASADHDIALNNSNLHLVWEDERSGSFEIYYKMSQDNGATWQDGQGNIGQDRLLTTNATTHMIPRVGVNGSTIHVVWVDEEPGPNYYLYYRNSTDNGFSWNPIQLLAGGVNDPNRPDITVDGNEIHIVWDAAYDDKDIYYINSTDGGGSWSAPLRISVDDTFNSYWPRIETNGSYRHIVWWDERDGNQEIYYKRYPDFAVVDSELPEINHTPVPSANIEEIINITANITDNVSVNQVYLNYTGVNATNYNVSMNQWNGNWSYDIPGQSITGFVDYFIWCNDTSGNDNQTITYQIQINDVTDPEINHSPVASANVFDLINITTNITDDVEVNKVFLNYTDVQGVNQNITMNKWNGNYSFDIPGQNDTGFVDYFIWCNDTSGNDNWTITYQIQIFDVTDPEIIHVPITSANISETINITANVTDDVSVSSVYLNYTGVNGTSYNVSMQKWNGNYSYEIPGQNTIGNAQYFIWANDSDGNDNRTIEYSIQINDITDPEINHTPVPSANVFDVINITVNVTDDVSVDKVYLNYTDVAGDNYNVTMNKYNGNWSYEISGQNDIGVVSYFIWANDTSGNDNQTAVYQVQINDITKPEIEHTPVTSANVSEAINITAQIIDDVEVDSVYLNYTGIDGTNYNVSMNKWNGNWSYEIPGQSIVGTVSYFIWCNDTSSNENRTIEYTIQINEVVIPDTTPPTIITKSPTGVNVPITTIITITFNESMNTTSVENAITISPAITISSYSWNADNTTLTITPSSNLSYNTTYNVTIGTGAKDVAGNGLENPYSWEYTTELEPITNGPDDGVIEDYWWVGIIIFLIAIIILLLMPWNNRKKEEEPEEYDPPIEKQK